MTSGGSDAKRRPSGHRPEGVGKLAILEEQYSLPWEERRSLIPFEGRHALTQQGVEYATKLARQYQLPLTSLALIATQNGLRPYVTAEGMVFRLHHDPRGVPSIETEVLDWGDTTGRARVRATVRIGEARYVSHAQLTLEEERKRNPRADMDTVVMKAETKSIRRACQRAVGIPFPVYEEAREYVEESPYREAKFGAAIDAEFRDITNGAFPNAAEFLAACKRELGMDRAAVEEALGMRVDEIVDFDTAYRVLSEG